MDFRNRLREQIELSGLLDKEVADRAGITKRAIDCYVGARACMPSADVAVRLAKVLGVTVEYLVTGYDSEISPKDSAVIKKIIQSVHKCDDFDKNIILRLAEQLENRPKKKG